MNSPEGNQERKRSSVMSRVLKFLRLGYTDAENKARYEAEFRHPSFQSRTPNSPKGIDELPPHTAE